MNTEIEKVQALKTIAQQLTNLNRNFEMMLRDMERARRKLENPIVDLDTPAIGSTGEIGPEPSDK